MKKVKKGISVGKAVAIGAGVAAVGAGAYLLLGPKGKANQKKVGAWMADMKKEVGKEIKKAKNATAPVYHKVVDTVAKTYSKKYKDYSKEIAAFAKTLKTNPVVKKMKASPVVKKAKKVSKKVTSKK